MPANQYSKIVRAGSGREARDVFRQTIGDYKIVSVRKVRNTRGYYMVIYERQERH